MFCPNCGKEIKEGAGFCTWCGAKVQQRSAEAPTPAPAPEPTPRKRRGGLVAVIVVALLVIAGAAGYLAWSVLAKPIAVNVENFPNAAVRSAVSEQLDPDRDGEITREEAAAATQLTISGTNDVSGLGEFFPNLTTLIIDAGLVEDGGVISVGDLTKLTRLEVYNSTVGSIDLSGNTELEALGVGSAPNLKSLDLSNNTQLTGLALTDTGVGELDLSANTSLERLDVNGDGEGAITLPATETLTIVNVPANRPLNGLENTGLREVWDVTSIYSVPTFFGDAPERADIERDDQGRITSIVANNNRGTDTYEFAYDEGGDLANYSFSAIHTDDVTITRNEDGSIAAAEGDLSSRRYTYDDQGRVATMELVDENGSTTTTFTYDDAGNLTKEHVSRAGTTGYVEIDYSYDAAGNLARRVMREVWGAGEAGGGEAGSAETDFAYEYDEAGNCVRTTITSSGTSGDRKSEVVGVAVFEATYDEGGNITKFVANIEGDEEPVVETYVYDDRGLLTRIEGSEHMGYDYELEYERRLVAKDATGETGFDFASDPMSGADLGQNIYYDHCAYRLMAPDYAGSYPPTRLSMTLCDI